MRRHTLLTTTLALALSTASATGRHAAGAEGSSDDDYTPRQGDEAARMAALDGYGEWVAVAEYGRVWRPTVVSVRWRPYTRGRWLYRPGGWTWMSDFRWGWVAFHYGRWVLVDAYGWVWVPGNTWGPAWVAWTYTDAYVGWAPLPPWAVTTGVWYGTVPDPWWCFAPRRSFGRRRFRPRILPKRRNPHLIRTSRPRHSPRGHPRTVQKGRRPRGRPAAQPSGRPRGRPEGRSVPTVTYTPRRQRGIPKAGVQPQLRRRRTVTGARGRAPTVQRRSRRTAPTITPKARGGGASRRSFRGGASMSGHRKSRSVGQRRRRSPPKPRSIRRSNGRSNRRNFQRR